MQGHGACALRAGSLFDIQSCVPFTIPEKRLAPVLDKRRTTLISVGLEWWGNPRLCM